MIRVINVLFLVPALFGSVFPQTPPPLYRVPADYSYFTAENKDMPSYPPEALSHNIEGDVILVLDYSTEGSVETVQGVRGDPVLVKAALEAVRKWKFRPIQEKGQKARGMTYVGFHFVAATKTVSSSLPFGDWEPSPAVGGPTGDSTKAPERVLVGPKLMVALKISGSNPRYPEDAKHNRIQGEVQLRAFIDRDGHVSLLEVLKARSTDLAVATVDAVKTWKYKPYLLNGEPIDVETTVTVHYRLAG